jgi:signal transduction histidine kinase
LLLILGSSVPASVTAMRSLNDQYCELAELTGGFVHEIRNHLSTLKLNLQLLAEDFAEPQNQREKRASDRVARLQAECQRLTDVAEDFLRFVRIGQLQTMPTQLGEVVMEVVDFFQPVARRAGIEIRSYVPSELPLVELDRELFKQVLLNLLINAEQAMPNGGEIVFLGHPGPRSVCLSLIDTGQGMPPEIMSKLFRPFFTTKANGNGLGLPTCRRIVESHGGKIEVQSEPGRGTKFSIWLPSLEPAPAPMPPAPPANPDA